MHPTVDDLYLLTNSPDSEKQYRKRRHSDSSDDDASSPKSHSPSIDDDRRAHHNELERRRRDHIKDHFMILKDSIPLLDGEKSSRALILKRAVEYISVMQSRLSENQRNMEELRRKNELLEEKLKDRSPSTSPQCRVAPQSFNTTPVQMPISPIGIQKLQNIPQPVQQMAPVPAVPQNASAAALSVMDPMQLNNLIASSQEAIMVLTQSLLGKMHTGNPQPIRPEPVVPNFLPNNFQIQDHRQMTVRF